MFLVLVAIAILADAAPSQKLQVNTPDTVIVTSDNPRTEDPQAIIDEIVSSLTLPAATHIDRREAIALAVEAAGPEDVVVIAGRGHEKTQIFAHQTITFDDATVVKELTCTNT